MGEATFYTESDSRYFIGTVALLNSLRLTGNRGELVVLDCGLSSTQVRLLAPHVSLVPLAPELARRPFLSKPYLHLLEPSGEVVWLDSDMIVTRPLSHIVEQAERGSICLYPVDTVELRSRSCPEWEGAFSLGAPLRLQPYLNSGLVAFSAEHWPDLCKRWWEACSVIPDDAAFADGLANPFWAPDQDALNALLMSEVPFEAITVLPREESIHPRLMHRVQVLDPDHLVCTFAGTRVTVLHYTWSPKPWVSSGWMRIQKISDAYLRLLPRVLFSEDVVLRLDPGQVPVWIRPGQRGALARCAALAPAIAWNASRKRAYRLPTPIKEPLKALRDRVVERSRDPR